MASRPMVFEEMVSFTWQDTAGIGRGDCKLFLAAEMLPMITTTTSATDERPIGVKVTFQTFLRLDLPSRTGGGKGTYFFKLPAPPGPVRCDLDTLWMLLDYSSGLSELITEKVSAFRSAATCKALRRGFAVTRVLAEFEHVRTVQLSEVIERRWREQAAALAREIEPATGGTRMFCLECVEEVGDKDWLDAVRLDCSHVFHVGCIHRCLQARFSCPFCGSRPNPLRSEAFPRDCGRTVGYLMREENNRGDGDGDGGGSWCTKLLPAIKS